MSPLMVKKLILGSASPRRRDLLAQIGVVPSDIRPADIDETPRGDELPRAYVLRIAREKADAVAKLGLADDELILSADTVVAVGRRILGKPENDAQAAQYLQLLSGRRHRVISAVVITGRDSDGNPKNWERRVETQVRFKRLSDAEISGYIRSGEWQGKAGGYAIQGTGAAFVPAINGSYTNVVGLPLTETAGLLEGAGFALSFDSAHA